MFPPLLGCGHCGMLVASHNLSTPQNPGCSQLLSAAPREGSWATTRRLPQSRPRTRVAFFHPRTPWRPEPKSCPSTISSTWGTLSLGRINDACAGLRAQSKDTNWEVLTRKPSLLRDLACPFSPFSFPLTWSIRVLTQSNCETPAHSQQWFTTGSSPFHTNTSYRLRWLCLQQRLWE